MTSGQTFGWTHSPMVVRTLRWGFSPSCGVADWLASLCEMHLGPFSLWRKLEHHEGFRPPARALVLEPIVDGNDQDGSRDGPPKKLLPKTGCDDPSFPHRLISDLCPTALSVFVVFWPLVTQAWKRHKSSIQLWSNAFAKNRVSHWKWCIILRAPTIQENRTGFRA